MSVHSPRKKGFLAAVYGTVWLYGRAQTNLDTKVALGLPLLSNRQGTARQSGRDKWNEPKAHTAALSYTTSTGTSFITLPKKISFSFSRVPMLFCDRGAEEKIRDISG